MPRQSSAARLIATSRQPVTVRLRPPDDLDEAERQEFLAIVLGNRPDHFQNTDAVLVACYAIGEGELDADEQKRGGEPHDKQADRVRQADETMIDPAKRSRQDQEDGDKIEGR